MIEEIKVEIAEIERILVNLWQVGQAALGGCTRGA